MRTLKIAAAAALLVAVMAAPVDAAVRREFRSQIRSINEVKKDDAVLQINGRVASRKAECLSNRSLRAVVDGANIFFGTGTTDGNGFFSINGSGPRDVNYRITLARSRPAGFRCGGDTVVVELG